MPNDILRRKGIQFLFRDGTAFPNSGAGPPTTAANNLIEGTPTQVQINLASVAANTARQSAKLNLTTPFAAEFTLKVCVQFASAPTANGTVDFFWNASPNATVGTGNMGTTTGADSAFTVGPENQMVFIGSLILRNATINIGDVGILSPTEQYGSLVVINRGSTAFASTMDETHITLTGLIDQIQTA